MLRYLSLVAVLATFIVVFATTFENNTVRTADAQTFVSVCDRSAPIRDAILSALTSISDCADVRSFHLLQINTLRVTDTDLTSVSASDYSGIRPQRLVMTGNRLTAIPTAVMNSSLTRLDLSRNNITRLDEDDFSGASNLRELKLNDNDFSGANAFHGDALDPLTDLTTLQINRSQVRSFPAGFLDSLTSLRYFETRFNAITALHPDLFENNIDLRQLSLEGNSLTEIDRRWLRTLTRLTQFSIRRNKLTSLGANAFTTTSDGQTYTGATRISTLFLQDNQITTVHRDAFKGLNLWSLDLQRNNIARIPSGLFDDMPRIGSIQLQGNQLTRIEADTFDNLTNLYRLSLQQNQIQTIEANAFVNLTDLTALRLESNQITELHADLFADLRSLETLLLQDNRINAIGENTFNGLPSLPSLWLHRNAIQEIHPNAFNGLDSLERLYLFSNQIQSLPYGVFDGLDLDRLWVHRNPGSPFRLPIRINVEGSNKAHVAIPHGAVFDIDAEITATNANPTVSGAPLTSTSVDAGTTKSPSFDLNPTTGGHPRITLALSTSDPAARSSSGFYGIQYFGAGPEPPTGVEVRSQVNSVDVSWDTPETKEAVYYHEIRRRPALGEWSNWETVPLKTGPRQSTSVGNLATTNYNFQVRAYSINGYSQPVNADGTRVFLPVISRIEPQIVSATVVAGQQIRLTANVFNMQDGDANESFDQLTGPFVTTHPQLQWSDNDGGGKFTETDTTRTAFYTTPATPGRVIITTEAGPYGVCRGHHQTPANNADCIATFTIQVVVAGNTESPAETAPRNPSGQVPTILNDRAGIEYEVATPEEGGTLQVKDCYTCPTVTIPVGAVPNLNIIGVRATTRTATVQTPDTANQLAISNEHTSVTAVDQSGDPLTNYTLNKPMQICVPLPAAFRSRLDTIALFEFADDPSNNRVLPSKVYTRNGNMTMCSLTDRLPTTVAPARRGALDASPVTVNEIDELPETGPTALNQLMAFVGMFIGLALAAIGLIYYKQTTARRGCSSVGRALRSQ